jgi:hypothetical protein
MLWIEDTIENIPAHPFFTNSIIDMASFVNLHKVIIKNAFFILDTRIGPQAFSHNRCTIRQNVFFNVKNGPIQDSILFKLVLGLLVLVPLSKVALNQSFFFFLKFFK